MLETLEYFANSIVTVLFLPLWIILVIFLNSSMSFIDSKKLTLNLSLGGSLFSIVFAVLCILYCVSNPAKTVENNVLWLNIGTPIYVGTFIDKLSSIMLLITSIFMFFIQLFTYRFIQEDKYFHKFYIHLNLLAFAIYGLILSSNVIQSLAFAGLIGILGYLLMIFKSEEITSAQAAKQFLITNCFGDICLLSGSIALIYFSAIFSSAQNLALLSYSGFSFNVDTLYSMVSEPIFCTITLFVIIGLMIKSLQFPFGGICFKNKDISAHYFVLPIILGFVGIYLAYRLYPMIIISKFITTSIVIIGLITAFVYSFVSMSQNNLKKILINITFAQIGVIFMSLGLGLYSSSALMLINLLYSMATLLLVASSVTQAVNNQDDIKLLGGLRKELPLCSGIFILGSLSLIIGNNLQNNLIVKLNEFGNDWIIFTYLIVIFLLVYSSTRMYLLVFENEKRANIEVKKISKIQYSAIISFLILAISFVFAMGNNFKKFVYFIVPEKTVPTENITIILSIFVILCASYIAFRLYVSPFNLFTQIKEKILRKENLLYKLSYNEFYINEILDFIGKKMLLPVCKLINFIEIYVIEMCVFLIAQTTKIFGTTAFKLQNGNTKSYLAHTVTILTLVIAVTVLFYVYSSLMGV